MKRLLVAATMVTISSGSSQAGFMTFSEWAQLGASNRAYYIAGAFDSLTTFSERDTITPAHYLNCIKNAGMTNMQLADNILKYAADKPKLQVGTPQEAMINYLISACGLSPAAKD